MEETPGVVLRGKAWRFGDDVDTDVIIPARYLSIRDLPALSRHAMEPLSPNFAELVKHGDFIVAGANFGSGSSREHAVLVLKQLGVAAVICTSAARTFYRNAYNNGLPVVECPGVDAAVSPGEEIIVDLDLGRITCEVTGHMLQAQPIPSFMRELLEAGGLLPYFIRRTTQGGSTGAQP